MKHIKSLLLVFICFIFVNQVFSAVFRDDIKNFTNKDFAREVDNSAGLVAYIDVLTKNVCKGVFSQFLTDRVNLFNKIYLNQPSKIRDKYKRKISEHKIDVLKNSQLMMKSKDYLKDKRAFCHRVYQFSSNKIKQSFWTEEGQKRAKKESDKKFKEVERKSKESKERLRALEKELEGDNTEEEDRAEKLISDGYKKYPHISCQGWYKGETKNNLPHGIGTCIRDYRYKYIGSWINGHRNGQGTLHRKIDDSVAYVGDWKKSKEHGNGTSYHKNGEIEYKGEWYKGSATGYGKIYSSDGHLIYKGEVENLQPYGSGTLYLDNGKFESDDWRDGENSGWGRYRFHNGSTETYRLNDGEWEKR